MELGDAEADDGEEAAALGAFLAVAEEEVTTAGGAKIADEDVLVAEAGAEKLGAVGFAEVEEDAFGWGLVARGHHVQPLDGIGFVAGAEFIEPVGCIGELREELRGDFGAHFVAAATYGRADGGEEVGGLGLELHLHFADSFGDDAGQGATPAGMNGSDGALSRVDEENGDAIGGLDAEEDAGAVGDRGVALTDYRRRGVEEMDDVGVDLLQGDEFHVGGAKGGLETAAVLQDVFLGVPFGEAEIQDFLGVLIGDAAGLGAKAVDQPGEFGERGHLEN